VQREEGLVDFHSLPNLFPSMLRLCSPLLWALPARGTGVASAAALAQQEQKALRLASAF